MSGGADSRILTDPVFRICPRVVFVDFGVVPLTGYPEGVSISLKKLQRLRRQYLRLDELFSGFLRETPKAGIKPASAGLPVRPILLGTGSC